MMQTVNSSYIAAIGYDPHRRELRVQLAAGGTDVFADVEQEVFDQLQLTDSKGSFVRTMLRGRYRTWREG